MHQHDHVIARILELLRESMFVEPRSAETDLVADGAIDSAAFMDLFLALEREFGIRIEQGDLHLDHFRTVDRMAAFVLAKQRESPVVGQ